MIILGHPIRTNPFFRSFLRFLSITIHTSQFICTISSLELIYTVKMNPFSYHYVMIMVLILSLVNQSKQESKQDGIECRYFYGISQGSSFASTSSLPVRDHTRNQRADHDTCCADINLDCVGCGTQHYSYTFKKDQCHHQSKQSLATWSSLIAIGNEHH